ncbi:kinase domain protein [Dictyocaulus viviparus]|uniref:mitogen-activated protein kinase kinase n=1 Tax=Dictyocaulus viviparus TaxID=29172 RepID=A0A0D8XDL4_DICVI|nr:kinase domain protein [Dictyocaulus viviparus]
MWYLICYNETKKRIGAIPDISNYVTSDKMKNYKKRELLGRGACGKVWKAQQKRSEAIYAMKIIHPKEDHQRELAAREVLIMRSLNHPYVVKLEKSFLTSRKIVLLLEYCDMGSLKQLLDASGKLNDLVTAKIFSDVCHGLMYLHQNRIIHCDIKPDNILLTTEGVAKISDFGISLGPGQIHKKCFYGSDAYAAPETYTSKQYTIESDIWSVGVVLYEMMTGRRPFRNQMEVMTNNLKLPPQTPYAAHYLMRELLQLIPENRLSLEEAMEGWAMVQLQKLSKYKTVMWGLLGNYASLSKAVRSVTFKNEAYHLLEFV